MSSGVLHIEKWLPISGWEGLYEVSDFGRVKSFQKLAEGRILRPGASTRFGHLTVSLGRYNSHSVHVLVAEAFIGPRPIRHDVLHINGDARDNRLVNIRYGTRSENNLDISRHGRRKLKIDQVKKIKNCSERTEKRALALAYFYGVSRSAIWMIWYGKNWSYV